MNFEEFLDKYQKVPVPEYPNKVLEVMPEPILSVRVSTYMHAKYIRQCLDGILMQKTSFPFEILIGEDQSSDGTREICIEYAEKYPNQIRLFLHCRENNIKINGMPTPKFQGTYTNYKSRGKYLAVCEGDDYWSDPEKLERQVTYLENNPRCAFTCHDVDIVYEDVPEVFPFQRVWSKNVIEFEDVFNHHFIPFLSLVYRKQLINDLPDWFSKTIVGDIPLGLILSYHGYGYYFFEHMGVKRKNKGGVTQDPNRKRVDTRPAFYFIFKNIHNYTEGKYISITFPKLAGYERAFAIMSLKELKLISFIKFAFLAIYHEPGFLIKKIFKH
jgi:glycosyltransferase involved in cell wall biosynthesis